MIREPRSEFVGRSRELTALGELLDRSRLVTLTGVGGVGKTRLAIRAANERAAGRRAVCWFVPLDSLRDGRGVARAVARALPSGEQSARHPLDVIADAVGDAPATVVLDNAEHLLDAVAAFADELLDAVPTLTVVATSRRRLDVDGEQVYAVPPLDLDGAAGVPAEAVELLVSRARSADAGFALHDDDVDAAAALCRALDGLPLAIELAAARLRTLSVDEVAGRLSSRFTLLRSTTRSTVARQRTLRAVVDWSHDLCTPDQRELWAALSVFAGSFDLDAAVAVAGRGEQEAVDALDGLVAQSVVVADRETGRFRLLESIRGYGRERAEEAGVWGRLLRRHLDHYRRSADAADARWYGPDQARIAAAFGADRAEYYAALETALAIDADTALGLFRALRYHWGVGGFLPEARRWAARVLALPGSSPGARAPALLSAAWLCLLRGDLDDGARLLDEAHALQAEVPDDTIEIELHRWSGTHALFSGDPATAREEFARSIARAVAAGRPEEALLAQFQLSTASSHLRLPDADAAARSAVRFAEGIGEKWMRALALWSIALAAFVDGSLDAAEQQARQALSAERGVDDPVADCLLLELLGWVDAARGPSERSAVLLGAAAARWRRIGSDISVHGPQMTAHHTRCVERVRAGLGERELARCIAVGERMSPAEAAAFVAAPRTLSGRERQVAAGVHAGRSNREIAGELVLSVRTVDTHVQRILAKLGVGSRAQIAAWYEATLMPPR